MLLYQDSIVIMLGCPIIFGAILVKTVKLNKTGIVIHN